MDEICDAMNSLDPVFDPSKELESLEYSSELTIHELADSQFLLSSFNRYQRYLKYIDFSLHIPVFGDVIIILIQDFIKDDRLDRLTLAAKCMSIDKHILDFYLAGK